MENKLKSLLDKFSIPYRENKENEYFEVEKKMSFPNEEITNEELVILNEIIRTFNQPIVTTTPKIKINYIKAESKK